MNTLSKARPRPSMLIAMSRALSTPVNASLVNWQPWTVLKISGAPKSASAWRRQSTQNPASSVLEIRQASTLREYQSTFAQQPMSSLLPRSPLQEIRHHRSQLFFRQPPPAFRQAYHKARPKNLVERDGFRIIGQTIRQEGQRQLRAPGTGIAPGKHPSRGVFTKHSWVIF
jgi:hypothetical protein